MPHPYRFIINPKSGSAADAALLKQLRDVLTSRHHHVRFSLTESLEHAESLAHDAALAGEHLVAVGGDGTVRAVIEGLAGLEPPLLILPAGTENLLAQELGIDLSLQTALACLDHPTPRKLDLGNVNAKHFMAVVGVGFDAQVIRHIHRTRTGHITHGDYLWPIARTFWEHHIPHLTVHADGNLVCDERALVFIGNISRYAVGLPVLPEADPSDGLLSVTIYRYKRRRELLAHACRTVLGRADRSPAVSHHNATHITVTSPDPDVPVQLDGDPGPNLPLCVAIRPAAVNVLTPPPPPGLDFHPPLKHYHLRRWLSS